MKKNRILKFASIGIVIVALGFMGLNLIQAQVKTLVKPDKEPSYKWSMTVLPEDSPNIIGMTDSNLSDHIYKDGVLNTSINYKKFFDRKLQETKTKFFITIDSTPSDQEWVTFQNVYVPVDSIEYGDGSDDLSLQDFLNLYHHPLPEYDFIEFGIFFSEDLENFDIIEEGEEVWGGPWWINIHFYNELDWRNTPGDAHTLFAYADYLAYADYPFYITRTGKNTWKFRIVKHTFLLDEFYWIEEGGEPIGNSGKYKTVDAFLHPQRATTELSFVFELTREKI